MKKFLIAIIAFGALVMTSCSKDDASLSMADDNAIEFNTYIGRDAQSKAVVLDNTNLKDFGVYAFYTSDAEWTNQATPNFMYNQEVTKSGDNWTYSPKKYWPTKNTKEYISFFAFAPYFTADNGIAIKSVNTDKGTPTLTYTIAEGKLDELADFTADVIMNQSKSSAGATPDNLSSDVTFNFKHELSRLSITAQLDRAAFGDDDANKTKVNVKQIDFIGTGFATTATYTFANVSDTKGAWTYSAATSPLKVIAGAEGSVLVNNNTETYWLEKYPTAGYLLENGDGKKLFGADNYLFLIPPTAGGVAAGKGVSMHIYYDIVTADDKLENDYSISSAVKEIAIPDGILAQGKAYNFTLTFNLNEIVFKASVEDWGTEGSGSANVDWPKVDIEEDTEEDIE